MRFKNVFSIIGPAMVGPSSSHTAGAVRIGRVARQLLGTVPNKAAIKLYGSFAETYQGHGTDLALAAGLLDYDTDDARIRHSLKDAWSSGVEINFSLGVGHVPHPNTARVELWAGDRYAEIVGASIGGGNIMIHQMNGFDVQCTGEFPTLVLLHGDFPGVLSGITHVLCEDGINIGYMDVDRKARNGEAMTVIEADTKITAAMQLKIQQLPHMIKSSVIDLTLRS
ncbi:L-serine dehydratase, iron-sulfur-dependent subunit beta [Paenibacillus sp. BIHB 4019]|uniref:L-serine deaminase n=1 Tax=Paenibacillus sp. BIHB 4019 TaxID=1870819 RepID=A0A1B2DP69_9BACL|nr:L-serine ammonia-lyase, iron-sulfur-dependent subunit beta [Paenibacillus sp. BIHB 4019]ANY69503.1 L-serine dehydratase, iron-sulfur-dependent subunit beta [Paenibacillus sp. BIHB 4019]